MRPAWSVIAKSLTGRGVKVAIITNGFPFTDQRISHRKTANVEFAATSPDDPEEIHDMFRSKGSFQSAMEVIDRWTKNLIPVSVISTLHSRNIPFPKYIPIRKELALVLLAASP